MPVLNKSWEFLRKYQYWIFAVLLVVAFAGGRFSQVAEKQVEFKDKLVYVDRVVEKIVEIEKKHEDKVRIVYRETKPDGTKTEREEERTKTDTEKAAERTVEKVVTIDREVIKNVTVKLQPRVMIGVLVGYDHSPSFLKIPNVPNLALGAEVKVRIAGPVSVGIWGLNTGVVGGSLSVSF